MRRKLVAVGAVVLAALSVGAGPAAADPVNSANALQFTIVCPGMAPFEVTVVGAVGFGTVEGNRVIAVRQATPTQGSLELVECTATNPQLGTQTVFLQLVRRG